MFIKSKDMKKAFGSGATTYHIVLQKFLFKFDALKVDGIDANKMFMDLSSQKIDAVDMYDDVIDTVEVHMDNIEAEIVSANSYIMNKKRKLSDLQNQLSSHNAELEETYKESVDAGLQDTKTSKLIALEDELTDKRIELSRLNKELKKLKG